MLLDGSDVLKIADFSGSSITASSDSPAMSAMVDYETPSQIPGQEERDEKSDLFAFGSAMYEMAIGLPPYNGLPPREIALRYRKGQFPDLGQLEASYSAFTEIIHNCWHQKFKSAHEIVKELILHYESICEGHISSVDRHSQESSDPRTPEEVPRRKSEAKSLNLRRQFHGSTHDKMTRRHASNMKTRKRRPKNSVRNGPKASVLRSMLQSLVHFKF